MGKKPVEATTQPTASVAAPENADMATLAEAKRVCDNGDYEGAHQKVTQLPDPSPVRSSADFKFIEYSWATNILLHADTETDPAAKRALLERVAGAASVDSGLRKTANDRLAAMDQQPPPSASGARDAGKGPNLGPVTAHVGTTRTTQGQVSSPDPTVPLPPSPAVTRPVPRPPQGASPWDIESARVKSGNPADVQRARDMLEPRVFGHRATGEEVRLLKSICKNQRDSVCVQQCSQVESGN
jgi:hypothetical protein